MTSGAVKHDVVEGALDAATSAELGWKVGADEMATDWHPNSLHRTRWGR